MIYFNSFLYYSQIRLLAFHFVSFLYFKTSKQNYLILFHSFIIYLFHSILFNSQTPKGSPKWILGLRLCQIPSMHPWFPNEYIKRKSKKEKEKKKKKKKEREIK